MGKVKSHVVGLGLDCQAREDLYQLILNHILPTTDERLVVFLASFLQET